MIINSTFYGHYILFLCLKIPNFINNNDISKNGIKLILN